MGRFSSDSPSTRFKSTRALSVISNIPASVCCGRLTNSNLPAGIISGLIYKEPLQKGLVAKKVQEMK
jgi:hypothetical protein